MNSEAYVIYDVDTGEVRMRGGGPPGAAALQQLPDGLATLVVPRDALLAVDVDLAAIKLHIAARLDASAELLRQRWTTPGSGQAMTYQRKAAEAAGLLAGGGAATPFLSAEAAALGMTVLALAAEVAAQDAAWTAVGAKIEAARRKAKVAIEAAGDLAQMVAAAQVDWAAALAEPNGAG